MATGDPILIGFLHESGGGTSIEDLAERARGAGLVVAGVVRRDERRPDRTRRDMILVDLESGRRFALSQDRGPGAEACRLDTGTLEEVAGLLVARLEEERPPDLLVLSKFGEQEIAGHGFRQVVEKAVDRGVPVLVGVKRDHLDGFRDFGGGWEWVSDAAVEIETAIAALAAARAAGRG